jgi:hypothetical protein
MRQWHGQPVPELVLLAERPVRELLPGGGATTAPRRSGVLALEVSCS